MEKLTDKEMDEIMDNGTVDDYSEEQKKQIFDYAFGSEFMESDDKGSSKTYEEDK